MLKKLNIKFNSYILKFYTLTKSFHGEQTFLVSCLKKTEFNVKKVADMIFLFFLHMSQKSWFYVKLDVLIEFPYVSAKLFV
jgi:hypothetical protein